MVYPVKNTLHVLLTERSKSVAVHKGEISLPGGSMEDGDETLLDTAIRETFEEIGVRVEKKDVLGQLDDVFIPKTEFVISPFVARLERMHEVRPNNREVVEIIELPIHELLLASFREEERLVNGVQKKFYVFEYDGKIIWGATARILKQFRDLLSEGP